MILKKMRYLQSKSKNVKYETYYNRNNQIHRCG